MDSRKERKVTQRIRVTDFLRGVKRPLAPTL